MIIEYYTKNVFGIPRLYIANTKTKIIIEDITGKQTINEHTIKQFEKLGVTFKEIIQPK